MLGAEVIVNKKQNTSSPSRAETTKQLNMAFGSISLVHSSSNCWLWVR